MISSNAPAFNSETTRNYYIFILIRFYNGTLENYESSLPSSKCLGDQNILGIDGFKLQIFLVIATCTLHLSRKFSLDFTVLESTKQFNEEISTESNCSTVIWTLLSSMSSGFNGICAH